MLEKSTVKNLKVVCMKNGAEFTSRELEAHLKAEGICHELTIPKNPEQSGVAEHIH